MLLAVSVMASAVSAGGIAAAQDTAPKPEAFKDWELLCPAPKPTDKPRVCEVRTVIKSKEGGRLGALAVAANPDPAANPVPMIATALLPLGVDLTMIPALKVGDNDVLPMQFRRCLQRGCEAVVMLDDAQLAMLRTGTIAKVAAGIGGGKTAVFEFSLNGFTGAHDTMKKRIGKS
jgi:invasion protein IalB